MKEPLYLIEFPDTGLKTGGDRFRERYIPNPYPYKPGRQPIDKDSKRNSSGILRRNVIRPKVYLLSCTWSRLTEEQIARLKFAVNEESFKLKYYNIEPTSIDTFTRFTTCNEVYAGAELQEEMIGSDNDGKGIWSLSIDFVQY